MIVTKAHLSRRTVLRGLGVSLALPWLDAFLNASMILTGMGPVDPMRTSAAKLFASVYALFSGVVFLTSMGVFAAPFLHRLMHRFHIGEE